MWTDWYNMATTTARKAEVAPSMPCIFGRQQPQSIVEAETLKTTSKESLQFLY